MKLEVVVTDVSQCKKDLAVEVAAEEVKTQYEKAYEAYGRYVKVPGFRPGRVPRDVVKQRFGKEIKDEVVGQLLPQALEHAITNNKLRLIGKPRIEDISVSEGEPLKFKASIEVLPEIELKEYKGLKVTKRVMRVTDEDVERVINQWRENTVEFVPVEDRPSREGDLVSVDLVGKYVGAREAHEQEDLKTDNLEVEIGGEGIQPEFNENLSGVKVGDVREFRVVYPEDFDSKGLAGKTLDFTATVTAVRRKETPELNDDFARDFGEAATMEELRDQIRRNLARNAAGQAGAKLRDDLLAQIISGYDFEVPSALVEQQARERLQDMAYQLLQSGVPPEAVKDINWDSYLREARAQAVGDVRLSLVVSLIADAEGIEVGQDEIDAEMKRAAAGAGETVEQMKARLTSKEAISSIESNIESGLRFQKALDAIVSKAEIAVEEIAENERQPAEQEQPEAEQPRAEAQVGC